MDNNDRFGYDETKKILDNNQAKQKKKERKVVREISRVNNAYNIINVQNNSTSRVETGHNDTLRGNIIDRDIKDYNNRTDVIKWDSKFEKKRIDDEYNSGLLSEEERNEKLNGLASDTYSKLSSEDFIYNHLSYEQKHSAQDEVKLDNFDGNVTVKNKGVAKDKFDKLKKKLIAIAIALGTLASATMGLDMLNHSENYLSTDPNFEGRATFEEVIERTPENMENVIEQITDKGGKSR